MYSSYTMRSRSWRRCHWKHADLQNEAKAYSSAWIMKYTPADVFPFAHRAPIIGPEVVAVLLGGPIIGAEALTRFFALHVFVIPGLLIGALITPLVMVKVYGG